MTEDLMIEKYNKLAKKIKAAPNCNSKKALESLSDFELLVFITAKTYQFGRNFKDSLKNAKLHLKNRSAAIKLFSN